MTLEGEEIMDSKKIAFRYIVKGTFILDLLSVLPLNAMIYNVDLKVLDILGVLKLVRIARLPKLI